MNISPEFPAEREFALRAYHFYSGLVAGLAPAAAAPPSPAADLNLGGKLLYVGEIDADGRTMVVASNVAGAASLSATADAEAQRGAIRDGIVDFVVNSLDEALRILKNEIRKKEAVSVCVAQPPELIEAEQRERGVLPDLVRGELVDRTVHAGLPDSHPESSDPMSTPALVIWSVSIAPAHWLARLDALALESLGTADSGARRWLRLAPRYLGRSARTVRLVRGDREFATAFVERVQAGWDAGELSVPLRVEITSGGLLEEHRFCPELPGGAG